MNVRSRLLSPSFFVLSAFASTTVLGQNLLLVPDSGADKIWAFDPFDGHMVSNNYIPNDGRMQQVNSMALTRHGTLLMADESANAIHEYTAAGAFVRTFANAAGNGIERPYGMAVHGRRIYVTVLGGAQANTVQSFKMDGTDQATFASGFLAPRGILFRDNDVLVGDSERDNIERFGLDGTPMTPFHDSDGVSGIDFPQQMMELANHNVLVAGFSPPIGVYEFNPSGSVVSVNTTNTSQRGLVQLGNGLVFWTGGTRAGTFDPATGVFTDILNVPGASFRWAAAIPAPGSALLVIGGAAASLASRRRR